MKRAVWLMFSILVITACSNSHEHITAADSVGATVPTADDTESLYLTVFKSDSLTADGYAFTITINHTDETLILKTATLASAASTPVTCSTKYLNSGRYDALTAALAQLEDPTDPGVALAELPDVFTATDAAGNAFTGKVDGSSAVSETVDEADDLYTFVAAYFAQCD